METRRKTSLRAMEEKRVDASEDRISTLPESILQHFLSLLLAKDAAKMSTLSKTWYTVWSSLLYLNFGDQFFYREVDGDQILSEKIPELVNVVDQALANRQKQKISIEKFWLSFPSSHLIRSYVPNWIRALVASNIKELILKEDGPRVDGFNILPEEIFTVGKLNVLDLQGFKLELPPDHCIKFSSLQKLVLFDTYLDEEFIRALCSSCRDLGYLTLSCCYGLASLQIAATLQKLKIFGILCLPGIQMIDIEAPNLENIYIESFDEKLQVTCCKALKTLQLVDVNITDGWLEDILCNQLPNLEHLELSNCLKLQTIKISSNQLKYFVLSWCLDLIDVKLDTPNLKSFTYKGGENLPTLKLMKASALLQVELKLSVGERLDSHWYSMFMKFLRNFKESKAIKLKGYYADSIVIPKDMRNFVPPLYGTIDTLHIKFRNSMKYSLVNVVDSLLWMSPQLENLTFVRNSDLNGTLKFIYEDAAHEDERIIQRQKLKEIEMENFTSKEQQELRNYLFTKERLHRNKRRKKITSEKKRPLPNR